MTMKVVTTLYRRVVYLTMRDTVPIPEMRSRLKGVTMGPLAAGEEKAYLAFRPDQSRAELRARFERGDRCFVCWHQGRIVDAGWISTGPRVYVPYLRRDLVLPPGVVYHYDAYTLPAFRAHGLYLTRNCYVERLTRAEGFPETAAVVAVENRIPLLVLKRVGFVAVGQYHCLRLGPWQKIWAAPVSTENPLPLLLRPDRRTPLGAEKAFP